jgi:ribosomal-protein-alanine N-acetyltransferase
MSVRLEAPSMRREQEFLGAVRRSRALHRNFVTPPNTPEKFRDLVLRGRDKSHQGYFVVFEETDQLAGVINVGSITRGALQSAYLGYYAFTPHAGRGLMRAALPLVIDDCFRRLKLHRLEANIQPTNEPSIQLVKRLGFSLEGLSPRYLKVAGRWRDHERWALLAEDWRPRARRRRAEPASPPRRAGTSEFLVGLSQADE